MLVDNTAAHHRHHGLDVFDLHGITGKNIPIQHHQIRVVARLDAALHLLAELLIGTFDGIGIH